MTTETSGMKWIDRVLSLVVILLHLPSILDALVNVVRGDVSYWVILMMVLLPYAGVWGLFWWFLYHRDRKDSRSWRILMRGCVIFATALAIVLLIPSKVESAPPRLLIADLENLANSPEIPIAGEKRALIVALQQSHRLRVVLPEEMVEALQRMGKQPDSPLTPATAHELCTREGIGLLLRWQIKRDEAAYTLEGTLQNVAGNAVLAEVVVGPFSLDQLTPSIDRFARQIRRQSGDTLVRVLASKPLADATTPSLAALQAYSDAQTELEQTRYQSAEEQLRRAVELDPNFALALIDLASLYEQKGDLLAATTLVTRAHEVRERLTVPERVKVDEYYYWLVLNDHEQAIRVVKDFLKAYPNHLERYETLAYQQSTLMNFEEAEDAESKFIGRRPWSTRSVEPVISLWQFQLAQGKFPQALTTANGLIEDVPTLTYAPYLLVIPTLAQGKIQDSRSVLQTNPRANEEARLWLGGLIDLYTGRLITAEDNWQRYHDVIAGARAETPWIESSSRVQLWISRVALRTGNFDVVRRNLEVTGEVRDEYLAEIGKYYVRIGDVPKARQILEMLQSRLAGRLTRQNLATTQLLEAEIDAQAGNGDAAVEKLMSASIYPWRYLYWPVHDSLADIALSTHHCDVALRTYADMLGRKGFAFYWERPDDWVMAHYGMARAEECNGRKDLALGYYVQFVQLWGDDAIPAVRDARTRIAELRRTGLRR